MTDLTDAQKSNLRRELTVYPKKTTDVASVETPNPVELFRDGADGRFGVPRAFYEDRRSLLHAEQFALAPSCPMQSLKSTWQPINPFEEQATIIDTLVRLARQRPFWGGILQASCATGKSYVGTEFAYRIGQKTIILVGKEFLLDQWKEDIEEILPGARVGIIRQSKCQFKDVDFSIALLQSLARDDGSKYPQELYNSFGLLITDECHHIPSDSFAAIVPRFSAPIRLGLSATLDRKRGDEKVFYYHIGPVAYTAKSKSMPVKLRIVQTNSVLKPIKRGWDPVNRRHKYVVEVKDLNSAQVLSQLGKDRDRSIIIVNEILAAAKAQRKVLVLSERLEQLNDIEQMLQKRAPQLTVGRYTGQWFVDRKKQVTVKKDAREAAKACQVMLATKQIIEEGFSLPPLDTLILATPVNDLEQILGRIQRWCKDRPLATCQKLCPWRAGSCREKAPPIVVDIWDKLVPNVQGKYRNRLRQYTEMDIKLPWE
jgi:superfamily II DNA or RNA helicase